MNEIREPQPPHGEKPAVDTGAVPARMSIVAAHLAAVHDQRRRSARQRGALSDDRDAVRDERSPVGNTVGTIPRSIPEPVEAPIPIRRRTDPARRLRAKPGPNESLAPADPLEQIRSENRAAAAAPPNSVDGMAALSSSPSAAPPAAASAPRPDRALAAAVASVEETVARLMAVAARLDRQLPEQTTPAAASLKPIQLVDPIEPSDKEPQHDVRESEPAAASNCGEEPATVAALEDEPAAVIELPCDEPTACQASPHEVPASLAASEPDRQPVLEAEAVESEQEEDHASAAEQIADACGVVEELEEPDSEVSLEASKLAPEDPPGHETIDGPVDQEKVTPSPTGDVEMNVEVVGEPAEEVATPVEQVEPLSAADAEIEAAFVADAPADKKQGDDVYHDLAVLRDEILSLARIEAPPQTGMPCPAPADEPAGPSLLAFGTTSRRWPVLHDERAADHATPEATAGATSHDEAPFDALCRHLQAAIPQGRPTSLMFTSVDKRGMAAELAVALPLLAQRMQQRLLVIDATGGGPGSVTDAWQVKCQGGLTDVLVWSKRWGSHLRSPAESITLLPAAPYGLPRRIPADSLRRLLNEAGAHYRVVVVVTNPRSGVDPQLLAPMVDYVYLGLHLRTTSPRQALKAIARLQRAEGKVQGCILTGC